jgi:hypothetical protein
VVSLDFGVCGDHGRIVFRDSRESSALLRLALHIVLARSRVSSLFFRPQLSVSTFLALVLKICRNRFSGTSDSFCSYNCSK